MFFAFENYRYYLKPGPTDMRRQAEALARTVQSQMHLDPFSKSVGDVRRLLGGQDVFRRIPVQGGSRVF